MEIPLTVALVGLFGGALGAFVAFLSAQGAAQKQIDAHAKENKARRDHDEGEARKRRVHEHRSESWRAHRESIAEFLRALERTKYNLNAWGERRIEMVEKHDTALPEDLARWNSEIKGLADKVAEANLQVTYWSALLPTPLRDRARQAKEEIDKTRNSYFIVADMRGDAKDLMKEGDRKVAREVRRDAITTMGNAHTAFLASYDAVSKAAMTWLDEHQAPEANDS